MISIKNYEEVKKQLKPFLKEYLESKGIKLNGIHFNCLMSNDDEGKNAYGITEDGSGFKCYGCKKTNAEKAKIGCRKTGDIFNVYSILENKELKGQGFFYAIKELADQFNVPYELGESGKCNGEKAQVTIICKEDEKIDKKEYQLEPKEERQLNLIEIDEKNKTIIPGALARNIINSSNIIYCNSNFYMYGKGVYEKCSILNIQSIVKNRIDDEICTMTLIRDITELIKIDKKIMKAPNELDCNINLINVKNGLYNIVTQKLAQHSAEYLSTIQVNVNYNPNARGDVFKKLLNFMLLNEEQQLLLQEMVGYVISGHNRVKKLVILNSQADTEINSALNLIVSIIGQEPISLVYSQDSREIDETYRFSPQELEKEKEYVFCWAMDGVKRLIENNFVFTEISENRRLINPYKIQAGNIFEVVKNIYQIA